MKFAFSLEKNTSQKSKTSTRKFSLGYLFGKKETSKPEIEATNPDVEFRETRLSGRRAFWGVIGSFIVASLLVLLENFGLPLLDSLPEKSAAHFALKATLWLCNTVLIALQGGIILALVSRMQVPSYFHDGYERFKAASQVMFVIALLVLNLQWLLNDIYDADLYSDEWALFGSVGIFALWFGMFLLTLRQIQWLDMLLQLRRTKYTSKLRFLIFITVIAVMGLDIIGMDEDVMLGLGLAIIVFSFVFSISKVSWIVTFRKEQKKAALWLSLLALAASLIIHIVFNIISAERDIAGISAALLLVPIVTSLLATIFYMRVAIFLSLTLPAAAIIDKKISEVNSLSYVSNLMSKMYDFQQLLDSIARLVGQVSGATASWIIVTDDGEGKRREAYFNLSAERAKAVAENQSFLRMLERAEKPVFIENLDELPETDMQQQLSKSEKEVQVKGLRLFWGKEEQNDIRQSTSHLIGKSVIAIPLFLEQERIGTLLALQQDEYAFEPEDVSLLLAFANNITIAIDNARLYKRSMEQERYERELRLAQEIQQRLLPDRLPDVNGFQLSAYSSPAFEVGGDYYEAVTLKNGNTCVLVGDVSGKGISAALYMSVVKGIVLAVGRESNSPKELLERINEGIFGEIDRQSYITAIAVEIDTINSVLRVARAGHTPLAVRQQGKVSLVTPKGFGIGLVKSTTFNAVLEQVEVPVGTDDACLLFTDGVNEAANDAGEEFGMENVLEILRHNYEHSDLLTGELLRSLVQFSGGISQHDDLTFVAVVCREGGNGATVAGRQKYRR